MAPCLCANRGYVRALEEDDFGFPDKVDTLAELSDAILGRCRHCGAWWSGCPITCTVMPGTGPIRPGGTPQMRLWRLVRGRRGGASRTADGLTCAASSQYR